MKKDAIRGLSTREDLGLALLECGPESIACPRRTRSGLGFASALWPYMHPDDATVASSFSNPKSDHHNRSTARSDHTDPPTAVKDGSTRLGKMGCPAKRKSTAEREEFDMFPAQEKASIFRHWADPLLKLPAAMTGNSKLAERVPLEPMAVDLFSEDSELRKRVMAELLRFPESKALSPEELEDAVDRIMKESRPETASVASPGMVRMSNDDIRIWLVLLKTPTVDDILGVDAGGVFPPDWIEERRLLLEEQCRHKTKGGEILLVHKIRIDLITKGYVVFHKEYLRSKDDESSDEGEDEDDDEEQDQQGRSGVN